MKLRPKKGPRERDRSAEPITQGRGFLTCNRPPDGNGADAIQGSGDAETVDLSGITVAGIERIEGSGGFDAVSGSVSADVIGGGSDRDVGSTATPHSRQNTARRWQRRVALGAPAAAGAA
jgi:hypothetical protein